MPQLARDGKAPDATPFGFFCWPALRPWAWAATPGLANAAAADLVDMIIGSGYRESLIEARDIKKASVIQKDVIVAEDMAKFPELNLAESLQPLPGVQITREAGEGRRISLRGLGSDFARVQLNGMEVLGNVDSAQDSRGQRTRASPRFTAIIGMTGSASPFRLPMR